MEHKATFQEQFHVLKKLRPQAPLLFSTKLSEFSSNNSIPELYSGKELLILQLAFVHQEFHIAYTILCSSFSLGCAHGNDYCNVLSGLHC